MWGCRRVLVSFCRVLLGSSMGNSHRVPKDLV